MGELAGSTGEVAYFSMPVSTLALVARSKRRSLGVLFGPLAVGFAGLAAWSGSASQWVILAAAAVLALWMAELALRALR
ncbi:MAG: hypothetical protein OXG37_08545 [Actinomycetia bacterium]|nr:hypothetical protein [Actinomycetes bacterium]